MKKYEHERMEHARILLDDYLQVYKRTGEIKKAIKPYYRGKQLSDVYGRYSNNKEIAYKNCEKILENIGWEFVTSRGITSANCFSFSYAATIELENKYVIFFSSTRDNRSYMGDKYNSCCMNIKAYLLEE